nr:TolC family protein [Acidobacteriota bacterium]
ENRYRARAATVQSEVRQAWGRLAAARLEAELYANSLVPLSRRVVELTQTRYNAMLTGVFQLLDARRDEVRTEREGINALRDYWLARTDLERAVAGGRLPTGPAAPEEPKPATPKPAARQEPGSPDFSRGAS